MRSAAIGGSYEASIVAEGGGELLANGHLNEAIGAAKERKRARIVRVEALDDFALSRKIDVS